MNKKTTAKRDQLLLLSQKKLCYKNNNHLMVVLFHLYLPFPFLLTTLKGLLLLMQHHNYHFDQTLTLFQIFPTYFNVFFFFIILHGTEIIITFLLKIFLYLFT